MRYFFIFLALIGSLFCEEKPETPKHYLGEYEIIVRRSYDPEDHVFFSSEAMKLQARSQMPLPPPKLFELAQLYIMAGDLPEAKEKLQTTLSANPNFHAATLQLAFVDFWQGNDTSAADRFFKINILYPCNEITIAGLSEIGKKWLYDPKMQKRAIPIYQALIKCHPRDDVLQLRLAQLYGWTGNWAESERVTLQMLENYPNHPDAEMQLARIYRRKGEFDKARKLLLRHQDLVQAREMLGFIDLSDGNFRQANTYFQNVLKDKPGQIEARRGLALSHKGLHEYRRAKPMFESLLYNYSDQDLIYQYLFDTKHHTDFSLVLSTDYTQVKETDFFTKSPVVKYWYWNNFATFIFPLTDRLTVTAQPFYEQNKEFPIKFNEFTNFNVRKYGGSGEVSYLYGDLLTLRAGARLKRGQQIGTTLFPFDNQNLFEPWFSIRLTPKYQTIGTTGYFDSWVIKNFTSRKIVRPSQFITRKNILGYYQFAPDIYLKPTVVATVSNSYYNVVPNNKSILRSIFGRVNMPHLDDYIRLSYLFEYESYDTTSPNYLSFRRQYTHDLGINFIYQWDHSTEFWFQYNHIWDKTVDLSQQLNIDAAFIELANIQANRYEVNLTHRVKDRLQIAIGGYYYHSTFIIDTFNLRAALWWQF